MRQIAFLSVILLCLAIPTIAVAVPMAEEHGTGVEADNMTAVPATNQQTGNETANMTVVEVIGQQQNLTVLTTAINETDLAGTLSTGGPYTVFAPTDEAFQALGNETVDALLNNTAQLTAVLQYHVVEGSYTSQQLMEMLQQNMTGNQTMNQTQNMTENQTANQTQNMTENQTANQTQNMTENQTANQTQNMTGNQTLNQTENMTQQQATVMLQTLLGENLTVSESQSTGQLMVNNATVTMTDITAENGVVHVIDAVLMPGENAPSLPGYTFSGEDNNETVVLPIDTNLTIRLPENPSTGYSWNVTTTRGLAIIDEKFIQNRSNEMIVGAGGIHEWYLTVNRTGTQQFTAVYERPFENRTGSEERFQLTVMVEDNQTAVYSIADNGTVVTMPPETYGTVRLAENPTTGFVWNVSTTDGLLLTGDLFIQNETDLVGAGGVHEWFFRTVGEGSQTFSAIYKRPWENITGTEERFVLGVNVSGNMTGM